MISLDEMSALRREVEDVARSLADLSEDRAGVATARRLVGTMLAFMGTAPVQVNLGRYAIRGEHRDDIEGALNVLYDLSRGSILCIEIFKDHPEDGDVYFEVVKLEDGRTSVPYAFRVRETGSSVRLGDWDWDLGSMNKLIDAVIDLDEDADYPYDDITQTYGEAQVRV